MATGFASWSKTAGSNATADSSINWAEGQAPSSVNDSSRAMMARLSEYRDDISGALTTAGTSTAYTVSTNQVFVSLAVMNKSIITIIPHATSGASPTLAVDGLTAIAINYSTGSAVPTGSLKAGTPYALIYIHASTEFIVLGALAALPPLSGPCPVGGVIGFAGTSAPTGWLLCYGQSLLRTDYPALFVAIGTVHGAADGTHFSLPDYRGRVEAGKDDMGGSAASQLTTGLTGGVDGATLGAKGGEQGHALTTAELAIHTHTGTTDSSGTHGHPARYDAQANANSDGTGGIMLNSDNQSNVGEFTGTPDNTPGHQIGGAGAHTHPFTSNGSGSNASHNNVQPVIIMNKIIFAGI